MWNTELKAVAKPVVTLFFPNSVINKTKIYHGMGSSVFFHTCAWLLSLRLRQTLRRFYDYIPLNRQNCFMCARTLLEIVLPHMGFFCFPHRGESFSICELTVLTLSRFTPFYAYLGPLAFPSCVWKHLFFFLFHSYTVLKDLHYSLYKRLSLNIVIKYYDDEQMYL